MTVNNLGGSTAQLDSITHVCRRLVLSSGDGRFGSPNDLPAVYQHFNQITAALNLFHSLFGAMKGAALLLPAATPADNPSSCNANAD
jgi:hypothetical protein